MNLKIVIKIDNKPLFRQLLQNICPQEVKCRVISDSSWAKQLLQWIQSISSYFSGNISDKLQIYTIKWIITNNNFQFKTKVTGKFFFFLLFIASWSCYYAQLICWDENKQRRFRINRYKQDAVTTRISVIYQRTRVVALTMALKIIFVIAVTCVCTYAKISTCTYENILNARRPYILPSFHSANRTRTREKEKKI